MRARLLALLAFRRTGREGHADWPHELMPLAGWQPCHFGDLVVSGDRRPRAGTFEADRADPDTRAAIRVVLDPGRLATSTVIPVSSRTSLAAACA
jgi:hypothetical protein